MKRIKVDPARTRDLIQRMLAAADDHRLTPQQRVRAEIRLRQLKAIQRYEQRQQANKA